jgi:glucosamine--fructose-6-phosphate aminotransferase (isomerizing)
VHIIACGTSYHSGSVGRAISSKQICKLPLHRGDRERIPLPQPVVPEEFTVRDHLRSRAKRRHRWPRCGLAKQAGYLSSLAICNVPESSLVRESELVMLTRAGPEIGVASTKAFTTQLTALSMLVIALAKNRTADAERERNLVQRLIEIPSMIEKTLTLDPVIYDLAKRFADKAARAVPRAAARCPPSRWKARSSSRKSRTSTPRPKPPASSSTARWRWWMRHAGHHRGAQQRPAREAQEQSHGSARARRRAHRVRRSGSGHRCLGRRHRHPDAEARELFPGAGRVHRALQLLAYHVAILKGTDVDQTAQPRENPSPSNNGDIPPGF